jgi:hypothetical protein
MQMQSSNKVSEHWHSGAKVALFRQRFPGEKQQMHLTEVM